MHPEVPADSIDIPTGAWGNFYDSNTGELARGMVFKSKDHLKQVFRIFPFDLPDGNTEWLRASQNCGRSSQWLDQCNQLCSGIQISSWGSSVCLRHVCSNFNKKFNNIRLKDLCWRAGAEVNARKFERIMTEIRELNEEAYNWLEMIDKTQWTLSHDSGWRTGSHTYVVKLKHKTCSCGKWGTHGIPCSHAIQVSRHFGVNASNFIPQYYSIRAYRKTYQGRFEPLYGEEYWDPVDIELCIIRRSEFAEDQADMFRRGYQMKWIDHKHVLANNINLVKFRINCHNVDVVCSDGDEYPAALWACLHPSHQMALVKSQDVFVSLDGCYVQSLQRKMAYSKCKHMDQWE
ncbi:UNVERIFIED_CONTAM: hypothetical protein Scaly_0807700 [Sesamum calycinum]|uniref:SWIM-type domain-containing protein n=1 Tax=Sesamum calycinum TaxID=2727403 RepID=A0AAW2RBA2_9LAMI